MQRILSADEMRSCDEATIKGLGVPGLLLMENAGRSVVDFLHQEFAPLAGKHVVVACGKGNNAGDGFVVARHCSSAGARVTVLLTSAATGLKGDALTNFRLLRSFARAPHNTLRIERFSARAIASLGRPDLIVDAVFGTGFAGKLHAPFSEIIWWINEQDAPVVAVDIPSGVNGTTGRAENGAVEATATVTFGCAKWGLVCNEGRDAAGKVFVVDIGIPPSVLARKAFRTFLVGADDVKAILPQRPFSAHKYSTGKVLVIAGARGYTGAAALCAMSVLRAGAGAAVLFTPEAVYPVLARKLTEVIVQPLPSTDAGSVSVKALDAVRGRLDWADVVALGPGLSQHPGTQEFVRSVVRDIHGKLLVDADGLNALAPGGLSAVRASGADVLLTPHTGEFSRLTGRRSEEIEERRIPAAREFAVKQKMGVVLKGAPTVTADGDGTVYVNSTGNPGMATVGSGDVLTGLVAGLWAQGMRKADAAWAGVFLHGLAGDLAKEKLGERSLVAGDLMELLPEAIRSVERGERV